MAEYMDGRYFDLVLDYMKPNVHYSTITLMIDKVRGQIVGGIDGATSISVKDDKTCITRLVICGLKMRHSTLLVYIPKEHTVWWWNPRTYHQNEKLHGQVSSLIADMLPRIYNRRSGNMVSIPYSIPSHNMCNAYVLKSAIDICNGDLDITQWTRGRYLTLDIRQFVKDVQSIFGSKLTGNKPDIEYDFSPMGAAGGALGGVLLGGALGGIGGAALGGIAGATLGGSVLGSHDKYEEYTSYHASPLEGRLLHEDMLNHQYYDDVHVHEDVHPEFYHEDIYY